jgi:general secretion pathway protein D
MPHQVLVEILIAETDAGSQLDLGVEWSTVETPSRGDTVLSARSRPGDTDAAMDILTQNVFPQGLSVGIAHGAASGVAIPFLLQALKQDRDVRILSSVPLLVQNNTEAEVNVVENIPVLRSTIEGGAGTSRDVIQNIDRMDVGIKLKVTPHVNPNREITLVLNPAIEAIVDAGPRSQQFAPTIAKREIKTTITVPDRATVVISGLIREDKARRERKIPLLGDIPWLGWLFRYQTDTTRRNNLLVFVTPRIIEGGEQTEAINAAMERRTELLGVSAPLRDDPTAPRKE